MSEAFLVLRRGGATWAVAHAAVRGVVRRAVGGMGTEGALGGADRERGEGMAGRAGERRAREGGGEAESGGDGAFEVATTAGALAADELLGVTTELRLHPPGAVLRRYWPEAARGLAVHGALPLVLIDAAAPPAALRATAATTAAAPRRKPGAAGRRDAEGVR
jgi:hypothetical protein